MMLTKFCVSKFKKFERTLKLDLAAPGSYEFNNVAIRDGVVSKGLIYGSNDSGKSCLCLALFDITQHLTDNTRLPFERYDPVINLHAGGTNAKFEYDFKFGGKTVKYEYEESPFMELINESLSIDGRKVIWYDFEKNEGDAILKGAKSLKLESNTSKISRVKYVRANAILDENDEDNKAFLAFTDFVDSMLLFYSLRNNEYQGLRSDRESITESIVSRNKTKDFEKFLRGHGIKCTLTEKNTYGSHRDIFMHFDETGNDVEFWKMSSEGTKSLALYYYWFYVQEKMPSFIAIDEFDAFYHFRLAEDIVSTIREKPDVQIFLTTHNTDLLSNELLRPDCYFILKNGKIDSLNNLTEKDIRFGNNLQKMFKAGYFDE